MHSVLVAVDCGALTDPMNGNVLVAHTVFGSVAVYECDENYMRDGSQSRLCQEDATWSGMEPTCECT